MASESEVRSKAAAFARGEVSAIELHKWLSGRRSAIQDDLEADLWALVFEIGDRDIDEESARHWLAEKHELALVVLHPSVGGGQLDSITSSGLSNIQRGFAATSAPTGKGSAGVNRISPSAVA